GKTAGAGAAPRRRGAETARRADRGWDSERRRVARRPHCAGAEPVRQRRRPDSREVDRAYDPQLPPTAVTATASMTTTFSAGLGGCAGAPPPPPPPATRPALERAPRPRR